ncbi:MAG TPA: hypothetical protein VHL57_10220, partial [Flavobacteriales bacterium]|nr:hypothetical protein [Flavobacteriales bacterium]
MSLSILVRILSLLCVCSIAAESHGQGFPNTYINWGLPNGGALYNSATIGYNLPAYGGASSDAIGSENWSLVDMNGDARPDLVIPSAKDVAGNATEFSPNSNSFWKVYLNNGSGFSTAAMNWGLPNGGALFGGTTHGYYLTAYFDASSDQIGSENWSLMDINGDARPDLVVTSAKDVAGNATEFSPNSNSFWKVYLNNGSGFNTTAANWGLPNGGALFGGTTYGYYLTAYSDASSDQTGSENWSLMDINGDARPDLVIPSAKDATGNATEFSPNSNSFWKVYLNNGSGFSTTVTNWGLPNGGAFYNSTTYGYYLTGHFDAYSDGTGSENWTVMDMNGDARPDLVVPSANDATGNATEFSPNSNSFWKVYLNNGSGFNTTFTNWGLPNGGALYNSTTIGYNLPAYAEAYSDATGSENWSLMDLTGDERPDLVVPSAKDAAGNATEFSPASNSYWKVYPNTGSGFNPSITTWSLPTGGALYNSTIIGYNLTGHFDAYSDQTGSENWIVMDMNGDAHLDLVVPSAKDAVGNATEFSPTSNSYWKVYMDAGGTGLTAAAAASAPGLYPNPADASVRVSGAQPLGTVLLLDLQGRTVRTQAT